VFSSIAAFSSSASGSDGADIGLNALLGAGVFVTTAVVGVVALSAEIKIQPRAFVRDVVSYGIVLGMLVLAAWRGKVLLGFALAFVAFYVLYVIIVIVMERMGRTYMPRVPKARLAGGMTAAFWHAPSCDELEGGYSALTQELIALGGDESVAAADPLAEARATHPDGFMFDVVEDYFSPDKAIYAREEKGGCSFSELPDLVVEQADEGFGYEHEGPHGGVPGTVWKSLYWARVRWLRESKRQAFWSVWRDKSLPERCLWLLNYPSVLARNITIPMVESNSWSRFNVIVSPIAGLQFLGFVLDERDMVVMGLQLQHFLLLAGCFLSVVLYFTTHEHRPPSSPMTLFALIMGGFVLCVGWIYALANELVVLLEAFGVLTGMPAGVVGLTILAWGNSIGDMVSNVSVAKAGLGEMAIAGCYGGPLFNLLVGLGISLTLQCWHDGSTVFHIDVYARISLAFLFVSLLMTLMVVRANGFVFSRQFGRVLVGVYAFYSMVNLAVLLTEEKKKK